MGELPPERMRELADDLDAAMQNEYERGEMCDTRAAIDRVLAAHAVDARPSLDLTEEDRDWLIERMKDYTRYSSSTTEIAAAERVLVWLRAELARRQGTGQ